MASSSDYKMTKIEKGPLQRFKNQNLLIKKFGEIGLQIYKAITGKRTSNELKDDLGIDATLFDEVLEYMNEAGMVDLTPIGRETSAKHSKDKSLEDEDEKQEDEILPEEPADSDSSDFSFDDLKPLSEEDESKPSEEIEEISPTHHEEADSEDETSEEKEDDSEDSSEDSFDFEDFTEDEIKPIGGKDFEEISVNEKEEEEQEEQQEEKEKKPESEEETEKTDDSPDEIKEEEISFDFDESDEADNSNLSSVEKIISDKYGDIGLRVYSLIDGQRTAEEIMNDTGLTEAKLVEILDFMDEQGIIKLDYPKNSGRKRDKQRSSSSRQQTSRRSGSGWSQVSSGSGRGHAVSTRKKKPDDSAFVPMLEDDDSLKEARGVSSPLEIPVKAPLDIVKSVQMKAKIMLKFGEKGGRLLEKINGKNDLIDLSLELDLPLYKISNMVRYMLEEGMVIMKSMSRADVHKKYGDDGYSVYKRYGKEGLMLYELIGKELTIKQMADKITQDRVKVIDMFVFIHEVLGIELPIDREVLQKQLEL